MPLALLLWIVTFCVIVEAKPLHVVIDPGHGGSDNGAVYNGIREAELVMKIARELDRLLNTDRRFHTSLTRTADVNVPLPRRSSLATEVRGDIFISIHANAAPGTEAHGTEIYFKNELPPDEESLLMASRENAVVKKQGLKTNKKSDVLNILDDLARSRDSVLSQSLTREIRNSVRNDLGRRTQHIRQAPFHVLSEVAMPSALLEVGYLTHPTEAQWLKDPATPRAIARALYRALTRYKEKLDNR